MQKLYKRVNGVLRYHEAWIGDSSVIEHWGVVGERGETQEHELDEDLGEEQIDDVLSAAVADGFEPFDEDEEVILEIEYEVDGFGTEKDLEKRHSLEDRMNELLGWTGLGCCDGGSIGSGTMEVACFVVDFDVAKRVIEKDLKGTEFGDYSRIDRFDDEE